MSVAPLKLELEVRDYECDIQGIVNNAVYQNYLEHARHIFLKQNGVDFIALSRRGVDLVVVRAEIDYLYPLRHDDRFYVITHMERVSRVRLVFVQDIYRLSDDRPILKARIIGTALNAGGRPSLPSELEACL